MGPYITLSSDLSFVLEDSEGVCGYVLGALDSKQFYDDVIQEWLPTVLGKYPKPSLFGAGGEETSPEKVRYQLHYMFDSCSQSSHVPDH